MQDFGLRPFYLIIYNLVLYAVLRDYGASAFIQLRYYQLSRCLVLKSSLVTGRDVGQLGCLLASSLRGQEIVLIKSNLFFFVFLSCYFFLIFILFQPSQPRCYFLVPILVLVIKAKVASIPLVVWSRSESLSIFQPRVYLSQFLSALQKPQYRSRCSTIYALLQLQRSISLLFTLFRQELKYLCPILREQKKLEISLFVPLEITSQCNDVTTSPGAGIIPEPDRRQYSPSSSSTTRCEVGSDLDLTNISI